MPSSTGVDRPVQQSRRLRAMKALSGIIREALCHWQEGSAFVLAASLAFYAAISLAPMVTISLFFVSVFYGEEALCG